MSTHTIKNKPSKNSSDISRLPCRGCIYECKNYEACEGKLWRKNNTVEGSRLGFKTE